MLISYYIDDLTEPRILVHAERFIASTIFQIVAHVIAFHTVVLDFPVVLAWLLVAALALLPNLTHVKTLECRMFDGNGRTVNNCFRGSRWGIWRDK